MRTEKRHTPIVEKFLSYLLPHGPITARAMFGGYGFFYDKVIFAIIVENELYFRVDDETQPEFESRGSRQFIYEGQKRPIAMPYFTFPNPILKNPTELKKWIERAYLISLASKTKKKHKRV